jgi:AcrR family transcriptional regulator
MAHMGAETRDRIVESSAALFSRRGYSGTGIKQIVADARAPFGSIYHFFPDGKEALGEEVIRWSGERYGQLVPAIFDAAPDIVTAVRDFFRLAGVNLRASDYADPCPIATITLETASDSERLRIASADVFESWTETAAERFRAAGVRPAEARELALAMIAALEGAFVLCRAFRTTEALDAAGAAVADRLRSWLASGTPE